LPPAGFSRPSPPPATATAETATADLRAHFGLERATRLLRSADPAERLRGLERAAGTHTPEAMALLVRAAEPSAPGGFDPRAPAGEGAARQDARALLVVVRGLAAWTDRAPAREALAKVLEASTQSITVRVPSPNDEPDPAAEESENVARVVLARQEAAVALAESGGSSALDALVAAARRGGAEQAAALDALAIHPPAQPVLGGVTLTTPAMIALAVDVGDLRSLGAILGQVRASDAPTRAAAIAALGAAGDARVVDVAREALKDKEPRVRVAAADALVKLGAPDAAQAVEALVADDATARDALRIALDVRSEGVTKAAAARAAASSNAELRSLAVTVLGRQQSPSAVTALMTLATDPRLQGDAAAALGRSPVAAATSALESLGAAPATRRLAARAYLVRRVVRGTRSARLDTLLAALAASPDGADRAVAIEALVTLGDRPLAGALADRDPRVRRAAAMGSLARRGARGWAGALLASYAVETDETTREVLAIGLAGGDPEGVVPTLTLIERSQAGGPDAPLAAFALARRADEELAPTVDALLASYDPVLRAHAACGLGGSEAPDAVGRLARAYTWEGRVPVRRALVQALAQQHAQSGGALAAPSGLAALELASRLDPDQPTRAIAQRALLRGGAGESSAAGDVPHEVAWIRLLAADGATLPRDAVGAVVDADGLALPVAFDDDGYALVPGIPPGEALVRLAPRVSAYQPATGQ
jgi:HEAT repeat protein